MDGMGGEGTGRTGARPPRHRLPEEARPGPVRLQVADLDRSLGWYGRVLGLVPLDRSGDAALLGPEGGPPLVELRERPGAAPVPRRGRLGLYHFALLLPERADLGAFAAHLRDLGIAAGAADHLVSEALYLNDPDGLGVEVYADRPRSAWRRRGEEIVMTTDPLDTADLLRAAGGRAWEGAPPGTTVGHVHLHVGDLEEAAAFYHRALGLDPVVWSYPGALFLSAGGYHHHLAVNTWAAGAEPAGADDARLLEWEILLPAGDDVAALEARLEAEGHPVERTGADLVTRDPWGTSLRVRPARGAGGAAG